MPTPTFQPPQGQQSTAQLQDWIIKLVRDLNYLLENLDTVNINRLDANVIIANTITAGKMNVTQLSAIAADLGTITAGIIYSAYIATANGTYPRIEFSSAGNLLTAFLDASHYLSIIPNLSGTPALKFTTPSVTGYLAIGSALTLQAAGELDVISTTELYLQAGNYIHIVGGWIGLKNETTGNTLQTDLDAKASKTLPAWIAPTFQNSWQNVGGTEAFAGYYKDDLGVVRLQGYISSGTIGAIVFNLPAGYRPLAGQRFVCLSNSAFGEVLVGSLGNVTVVVGSNLSVSLAGISFRAEQ